MFDVDDNSLRARASEAARAGLLDDLAEQTRQDTPPSKSAQRLIDLKEAGTQAWQDSLDTLAEGKRWARVAFVTDVHLPYHDPAAVELAAQIVEDFKPDIMPSGSDVWEFQSMGSWENLDAAWKRIWDEDIQNPIDAHAALMRIWRDAAPHAVMPFIVGNHDVRLMNYLRRNTSVTADKTLADIYKEITTHGVTWLGEVEDIECSPGFRIMHGIYATKNRSTAAKNTFLYWGSDRSGLCGHAHDWAEHSHRGLDFDYEVHLIGCLAQLQPVYTPRLQHWRQGVALAHVEIGGKGSSIQPVKFNRVRGELVAHANGKEYRVKDA